MTIYDVLYIDNSTAPHALLSIILSVDLTEPILTHDEYKVQ